MQKLIAKYGTAAHLALLAVAPLFLFAFSDDAQAAMTLLWLSIPAAGWTVLEPSIRGGESLYAARSRVFREICTDPLFWVALVLVLVAGVRALNGGVALVYDAEEAQWNLSSPVLPFFPCCVSGTGFLPFATLVAGSILLQGCRHSLGRSARMAFLLMTSSLAGLAAVLLLLAGQCGNGVVREAMACSPTACFCVGTAFYLHLMGGTVALTAAFEHGWRLTLPLFILSIGGTAAAGFLFSSSFDSLVFVVAEILLLVYVFAYSATILPTAGKFKLFVVLGIALLLGVLAAMAFESAVVTERLEVVTAWNFLPDAFVAVREVLSGVAVRSWISNLWMGTGLGSFPLAFRFAATPEDWEVVRQGVRVLPNGWLFLLAERGIVGVLIVCLPVAFLFFTYIRRLTGWIFTRTYCHPACCLGPLVLSALAVTSLYSCSFLRTDVIIMMLAIAAVSANSFLRIKRKDNG